MITPSRRSAVAVVTAALAAALVVVAAGGQAGAAPDSGHCSIVVLPEPSHTRGRSNTIRWEPVAADCWLDGGTDRRFVVTIRNATGATDTVTAQGRQSVQARIGPEDFPGQAIDGQRFQYLVTRKERYCAERNVFGTCIDYQSSSFDAPHEVASTQDDRAPAASLVLAGGKTFVRSFYIPAAVTATDPGGAASGPGYVAFGDTERHGGCGPPAGCADAQPLGSGGWVRLEGGSDGLRTVEGRVYDRARGPADDPGTTTIGTPPGNVSAPFDDTVFLDRTAPAISIRISTMRVMVGEPVTFDASRSVDPPDGSGLQPSSGTWSFGDGGRAFGLVVTHTYATTGRFPFTFSVADNVGNLADTEQVEIEVTAAPVPPQPGTTEKPPQAPQPGTVDRRPPALTALALRRRNGRATVSFRLSERGTVRVEVRRLTPRPARRTVAFARSLGAGRRGIVLPAAATTKRGRYTIVLVARDRAGNVSKPKTIRLTIR